MLLVQVTQVLSGPLRGLREGVCLFCVLVWFRAAFGKEQVIQLCFAYISKTPNNYLISLWRNFHAVKVETLDVCVPVSPHCCPGRGRRAGPGEGLREACVCRVSFLIIKRSQAVIEGVMRNCKNLRALETIRIPEL